MKIILLSATTPSLTSPTVLSDTTDRITGSVFADQAGALHVQQSGDNVNWDIDDTIVVAASTSSIKIDLPVLLPYVRLTYVPTGSAPTVLRVFARLASAGVTP